MRNGISPIRESSRPSTFRPASLWRRSPLTAILIAFIAAYFLAFAVFPLGKTIFVALAGESAKGAGNFLDIVTSKGFIKSFINSMKLGVTTGIIGTALGFIFAFAVTRTNIPGKKLFDILGIFPIVSPPFVLALATILLFGRNGTISNGLLNIPNSDVYGFRGLVTSR